MIPLRVTYLRKMLKKDFPGIRCMAIYVAYTDLQLQTIMLPATKVTKILLFCGVKIVWKVERYL